jgi:hypothetical protein
MYYNKYIKYKTKYLDLLNNLSGGTTLSNPSGNPSFRLSGNPPKHLTTGKSSPKLQTTGKSSPKLQTTGKSSPKPSDKSSPKPSGNPSPRPSDDPPNFFTTSSNEFKNYIMNNNTKNLRSLLDSDDTKKTILKNLAASFKIENFKNNTNYKPKIISDQDDRYYVLNKIHDYISKNNYSYNAINNVMILQNELQQSTPPNKSMFVANTYWTLVFDDKIRKKAIDLIDKYTSYEITSLKPTGAKSTGAKSTGAKSTGAKSTGVKPTGAKLTGAKST